MEHNIHRDTIDISRVKGGGGKLHAFGVKAGRPSSPLLERELGWIAPEPGILHLMAFVLCSYSI